jgi:hypothetical protein
LTDDVYEPLARYRDAFKAEHARNTSECFEALVSRSGIDADANAGTVAEIRTLERQAAASDARRVRWKNVRLLTVCLVIACAAGLVLYVLPRVSDIQPPLAVDGPWALACLAGAAGGILLTVSKLNAIIRAAEARLRELRDALAQKTQEAWAQLAPLNRLYDWDTVARLIQKTVPRLALDPYFSCGRLDELRRTFGWDDAFNRDKSVLFAQSGAINGNPFVLAETLDYRMAEKTYTGTLSISWQERVRGSDGKSRMVTRHQTLHASVTKPAPDYTRQKFLIYGNEAAPTLTFSRTPSRLSGLDAGVINNWRKAREIKKLEAFSRNLDDDSGYTIMANREFAALFHATDRNDEVQYRLLFTPLAQHQMVALLKDKTVGYGDDFTFIKSRMINRIHPAHLTGLDISAAPSLFHAYDLAAARRFFNDYSNAYFKALYFALAPLLTIPLYQQHRSHADIYRDVYGKTASFWEHEAIANFHGEPAFRHPDSCTANILKTELARSDDGTHTVSVTAHGFRGHPRTDYIAQFGGDGRSHQVPVHWTEYEPVSRTSALAVQERDGLTLQDYEQQAGADPRRASFRRSILSFIPSR